MGSVSQSRVLTCIQCGKCTGSCPESGRTAFNVRMIVRKKQFQCAIEEAIPWYCTSCGACTLRCPRDVKPSEVIIDVRSALVEDGQVPVSIQKALENTFVQRNPWGRSRAKRGEWAKKLDIEMPHVGETDVEEAAFHLLHSGLRPEVYGHTLQRGAHLSTRAASSSACSARRRHAAATRSEG